MDMSKARIVPTHFIEVYTTWDKDLTNSMAVNIRHLIRELKYTLQTDLRTIAIWKIKYHDKTN